MCMSLLCQRKVKLLTSCVNRLEKKLIGIMPTVRIVYTYCIVCIATYTYVYNYIITQFACKASYRLAIIIIEMVML